MGLEKDYTLNLVCTQEQDCCSTDKDYQELRLSIEDGGGGPFFVMSTERWAFENIDELCDLIKEYENNYKNLKC